MSDHTSDIEVDIHQICKEGDHQKLLEVVESQGFFPEMLLESDDEGYLPIHLALIYNKIECVSILLALNVDHQIPYQGFMPIHLAMGRSGFKSLHAEIISTVLLLLKHQQDVTLRDRLGRTALHIACATGIPDLIPIFLQSGIKPDLKDFSGKMAIHYAIENHESECLRQILQEGGSDMLFCTDGRGDKPVHLAVRCGSWDCFHILISLGSEEMLNENNEYEQTPEDVAKNCGIYQEYLNIKAGSQVSSQKYTGTLIVTDDLCKFHAAIPESLKTPENLYKQLKTQPENPKRLEIMLDKPFGTLLADEFSELEWIKTVEKANISDILRVHEYSYISQIKTHINKLNPESFPQKFDIDTVVSSESYACALIAANCAIKAVDAVLQGDYKNAFCAVRPPGHHVGPYGAVYSEEDPGSKSTGFCLFNNVAIAAAYAKSQYHKLVKKIAVVDFDVHHGNGTEEIVKNLIPSIIAHSFNSVPFAGTLTSHSYKPWLNEDDAKNVLFISSHGYGSDSFGKLYPASGTYVSGADLHPGGVLNVPLSKQTDSFIFRQNYREKVFPRLIEFCPDFILISAGFDAHGLDVINHGFLDLDEDDFFWVTEELIKIANTCCKGKIVSVLEGGYSVKGGVVSALGQSVAAHIRALLRSNKEQWANTNASSDLEKLNLKTKVKEDLKTLKRKRRKYLDDLQKIDLNEFMQENLSLTQNKLEETDQGEESQVPSYSQESEQLINEQDSQDEVLIN